MNEDYNNLEIEYCRANSGKRFANYLIDLIVFYIILFFIGFMLAIIAPTALDGFDMDGLPFRLFLLLVYGVVMSVIEAAFQGKTLGKLITGTKAIRNDGTSLDLKSTLIRNLIRAIPFNSLSALGNPCKPWHDTLSNTIVVDEKKMQLQENKDAFMQSLKNQTL